MKLTYAAIEVVCCFVASVQCLVPQRLDISQRIKQVHCSRTSLHATTDNNSASDRFIDNCDVAIFGGGFGGLYTALSISREARTKGRSLDVVLVDPSEKFVFLPLLYDLTVGTASEAEVCPSYKDLLVGTGVRHVQGSFESFESLDLSSAKILTPKATSTRHVAEQKIQNDDSSDDSSILSFRASVVAVGATPESILASVPGASQYAQPFYTQDDAKATQSLLTRLESEVYVGNAPNVAIVGGGYGGVELAACVKRRIPKATVSLMTRGPPMKGTRAEPAIDKALRKLGVQVEVCSVKALEKVTSGSVKLKDKIVVQRELVGKNGVQSVNYSDQKWDAVLWTAGSGPAYPVSTQLAGLESLETGHLAIDDTLRCYLETSGSDSQQKFAKTNQPAVWALGDCAEIILEDGQKPPNAVPKTAQAAMQQADTVAYNIVSQLERKSSGSGISTSEGRAFVYQDLGTMLTLGGPNAALFAPKDGSPLAPVFTPILDTARGVLGVADNILERVVTRSPGVAETVTGITPELIDALGLSLSGYGLLGAVQNDNGKSTVSGALAGTLTGAARRAIYAYRMPTNGQRAVAATSAAIYGAVALAKEAEDRRKDKGRKL